MSLKKQESNCELYNVGLGQGIKVKDLVKKVIKVSGKDLEMKHDLSKPTLPTSLFLNCGKAERELGWKPRHSLEEGLKKTLEWYKNE